MSLPGRAATWVLAVVLALVVAGCAVSVDDEATDPATSSASTEPTDGVSPGGDPTGPLARFYGQQTAWKACAGEFECARVEVPVDYSKPEGETLELSVNRRPADGGSPVGALIVNPGGPGASGVEYAAQAAAQLGPEVLKSYDLVGFDPRGVADSDPVEC